MIKYSLVNKSIYVKQYLGPLSIWSGTEYDGLHEQQLLNHLAGVPIVANILQGRGAYVDLGQLLMDPLVF